MYIANMKNAFKPGENARILLLGLAVLLLVVTEVCADHLVLQVEDFEGPWRRQTNITGYLGAGFCTSNANPEVAETTMNATITIEKGGAHSVWVRAYTSENSNRACQVQVGETVLATTHTGSARHWIWEKAGEMDLSLGKLAVVVKDAADGFESVDAIMITDKTDYDPGEMDNRWLVYADGAPPEADAIRFNIEACCAALQARKDPATRDEWEAARPTIKQDLAAALGLEPMPERAPLNARITGKAERDLYRIENVVFESRPNFYVTANLYIPKNVTLPAPGIVVVAGHAMDTSKNCDLYQMAQLGLVRQGFVVLAHDPIGQGERRLPGFAHELGYGSLLVGQTNEGYIVWDTLRAFDYLVTRPEVDASRLGLCGNSGGGENTFYTMPFDERIQAGGSFCFVCSYDQWIRHGGNHCICNHLPGIVHKMEEFEIIGLNVARPFLFGNGAKDTIFPIAGVRDTYRRAQEIYGLYDARERVASVEADLGHGWSQPLREACYGWMDQWLQGRGDGSPIPEADYEAEDPQNPDILCFEEDGMPKGAETVVTLNRKLAAQLSKQYAGPPADAAAWNAQAAEWREAIWEVFGCRPADTTPTVRQTASFEWNECTVDCFALTTEPEMEVAAILVHPKNASAPCPAVVCLKQADKRQVMESDEVAELLQQGCAVLTLDPRGLGETVAHENHLTSDSICLGRPVFAQRVWDLLQATKYLASREDIDGARIRFIGEEAVGLLGLFAQALESPYESIAIERPLASYRFFLEDKQLHPISLCVPNVLKVVDIPQVAALAAPAPVTLISPVGYHREALSEEAAREEFAYASQVFAKMAAEERFLLE